MVSAALQYIATIRVCMLSTLVPMGRGAYTILVERFQAAQQIIILYEDSAHVQL
jgi:hypothetical protein